MQDGENIVFASELNYKSNGSDILRNLKLLQADSAHAQKIAYKGHEVVRRPLRPENVKRSATSLSI